MADKAPTEGSDAAAKPELTEAQKAKIERKRAEKEAKKKAKAAKKAAKKAGGAGAGELFPAVGSAAPSNAPAPPGGAANASFAAWLMPGRDNASPGAVARVAVARCAMRGGVDALG